MTFKAFHGWFANGLGSASSHRFADYKESMIELLAKVVRVSVNTVAITEAMKAAVREA